MQLQLPAPGKAIGIKPARAAVSSMSLKGGLALTCFAHSTPLGIIQGGHCQAKHGLAGQTFKSGFTALIGHALGGSCPNFGRCSSAACVSEGPCLGAPPARHVLRGEALNLQYSLKPGRGVEALVTLQPTVPEQLGHDCPLSCLSTTSGQLSCVHK